MIMLRSAHKAELKAKDQHIAHLENEVGFLRSMLQPSNKLSYVIASEANAVLDSHQEQPEPTDLEIISERDRLLSGNY